jgi:hypothetical protein
VIMLSKTLANSFDASEGTKSRKMGPYGGSDADLSYLEEPCEEPDAVQIEFWKGCLGQECSRPLFSEGLNFKQSNGLINANAYAILYTCIRFGLLREWRRI